MRRNALFLLKNCTNRRALRSPSISPSPGAAMANSWLYTWRRMYWTSFL